MSSLDDAVKTVFKFMERDRASIQAAQSYLRTPIPPPPHLQSALNQDYDYDFSSPDETARRFVFNYKIFIFCTVCSRIMQTQIVQFYCNLYNFLLPKYSIL